MADEFESCPFCGSDDVTYIEIENQNYEIHVEGYIFCRGCGFASDIFLDKRLAIEAWNRRVSYG